MGSEICRRVQSSQATKVTNMKVFAGFVLLVSASVAFPQAKSGCGTNERGVARKPGTTGKSNAIDADASSPEYQVAQRSSVEASRDCLNLPARLAKTVMAT